MLNVVDEYSRELLGQLVSVSISSVRVARFLDKLKQVKGLPQSIVCDNGTEFTSKAMFFWSKDNSVKLAFIHAWQTNAKRVCRELKREVQKRMSQPALVP